MNNSEEILEIMKNNSLPVFLATCTNGKPRIRAMKAIIEDERNIWFMTFCNTEKVEEIKNNPDVCIYFLEYPEMQKELCIKGKARIINDSSTKKRVWNLRKKEQSQYFNRSYDSVNLCLIKVTPESYEWVYRKEMGKKYLEVD